MKILSSVFLLIILFSCSDWPLLNPIDPESPNYIGQLSKDLDGDGIGQYADVDDITLIGPEDGSALSADDVLTITPFKAGLVSTYRIQIATDKDNFSASTIVFQDDSRENKISLPPLTQAGTYYWRAKAYDGSKWSDSWSEARSFTISYSGGIDIDSDMDDPIRHKPVGQFNGVCRFAANVVSAASEFASADSYHLVSGRRKTGR